MTPLERLFRLEAEFHCRLRMQAPDTADPSGLYTSYALHAGYEPLIRAIGTTTAEEVERLHARLALVGDARDIAAAGDSLKQLLAIPPLDLRRPLTAGGYIGCGERRRDGSVCVIRHAADRISDLAAKIRRELAADA